MGDVREMAQRNKCAEYIIGSQLYGTATPTSDTDFGGFFIADIEYYYGLNSVDEVDFSTVSKLENGRNAPDAIDLKLYELRKFVRLAMENNPNIIEQLFIPQNKMVFCNAAAMKIFTSAHLFPHKGLTQKFIGYAKSQLHKMRVKPENYDELSRFKLYFETCLCLPKHRKAFIQDIPNESGIWKEGNQFYAIGDLKFNGKVKMEDVYNSVVERLNKAGSRTDIFLKHGYDTKFGMHCIRLLQEGMQLLKTGRLVFPLENVETLKSIRAGEWTVEQVVEMSERLTEELDQVSAKSTLPSGPRFDEIEKLLVNLVWSWHAS